MKDHRKILLLHLLPFFTFIISCRKEIFIEESLSYSKKKSGKQLLDLKEKQVIKDWLVDHGRNLKSESMNKLEFISNNLNYDDITIEARNNGEDIIIIPIKDSIKEYFNLKEKYLKLDENSILNLMIVRSEKGKLRWSYIVSFHPLGGKKQSKLSVGTLQNILNNKRVEDEGMFKLINLNGKLSHQFEYKQGKISSSGTLISKRELLKIRDQFLKKDNRLSLKNAPLPEDCEDFYLVTTYYDGQGGTYEDWEYLYTECDGEEGGGNNNGEQEFEEDPDIEIMTDEEFTSSVVSYTDFDIISNPISLAPVGTVEPVVVRHEAEVWRRFNRIKSRITVIYPKTPTISSGQVSGLYFNSFLQQNVIRKANLLGADWWVNYAGVAATITWRYDIHYKYHAPPYVDEVSTRQVEHKHIQAVTAYNIGNVSW